MASIEVNFEARKVAAALKLVERLDRFELLELLHTCVQTWPVMDNFGQLSGLNGSAQQ